MYSEFRNRQAIVLLVEDNPGDVRLTKEALEANKIMLDLHTVKDGVEALDFLYKRGKYLNAPRPDLVLLDLNIPKKDGREVLKEIKSDEKLKKIVVVVLTTSEDENDVAKAYENYANCYISKPLDLSQFVKVIKSLQNFWFSIVKLPAES